MISFISCVIVGMSNAFASSRVAQPSSEVNYRLKLSATAKRIISGKDATTDASIKRGSIIRVANDNSSDKFRLKYLAKVAIMSNDVSVSSTKLPAGTVIEIVATPDGKPHCQYCQDTGKVTTLVKCSRCNGTGIVPGSVIKPKVNKFARGLHNTSTNPRLPRRADPCPLCGQSDHVGAIENLAKCNNCDR